MIHITKTGFKSFTWNPGLKTYVEDGDEPIHCLRDGVTAVEDGVTLEDMITFVARDEILRLVVGLYSSCRVMDFYDELRNGVEAFNPEKEIKYCTVAMEIEVASAERQILTTTFDFHGCGENGKTWALDLAPLAKIGALPFRLQNNARILHFSDNSLETEEGLEYTPSLLEVLNAIFFDLSFHGSPVERDERQLELEKRVQKLEDGAATL
jgi:hypothetical protein